LHVPLKAALCGDTDGYWGLTPPWETVTEFVEKLIEKSGEGAGRWKLPTDPPPPQADTRKTKYPRATAGTPLANRPIECPQCNFATAGTQLTIYSLRLLFFW
jgi:hypothetical protein